MDIRLAQEMCEAVIANAGLKATLKIEDMPLLGLCESNPATGEIFIKLRLGLVRKLNSYALTLLTLHEVAHGLVGYRENPHDEVWMAKNIEIGGVDDVILDKLVVCERSRWGAICPSCARLNTSEDDMAHFDFTEYAQLCFICKADLPSWLWQDLASISSCSAIQPTLTHITMTGQRLVEGALRHGRGLTT